MIINSFTGGSYGKPTQKFSGKKHEQAALKRHCKIDCQFFFSIFFLCLILKNNR